MGVRQGSIVVPRLLYLDLPFFKYLINYLIYIKYLDAVFKALGSVLLRCTALGVFDLELVVRCPQ